LRSSSTWFDEAGEPSMRNADVLAAMRDPYWSPELGFQSR